MQDCMHSRGVISGASRLSESHLSARLIIGLICEAFIRLIRYSVLNYSMHIIIVWLLKVMNIINDHVAA